jgi:hypothetical protein
MQASKVGANLRLTLGMGKVGLNFKFFWINNGKKHGKETKRKNAKYTHMKFKSNKNKNECEA